MMKLQQQDLLCTILGICLALVLTNCTSKKIELKQAGKISVDLKETKDQVIKSCDYVFSDKSGEEFFIYSSSADSNIKFLNIRTNSIEHSINIKAIDPKYPDAETFFFVHSYDSIFILQERLKTIFLLDKEGSVIYKWPIQLNRDYNYALVGYTTMPFYFTGRTIYARIHPWFKPSKEKGRYYSIPPEIAISVYQPWREYLETGGWPEKYKLENFYDNHPYRCNYHDHQSELNIYSFAAEHDLYVFNKDSLVGKYFAGSASITGFVPFIDDSVGNIAYTMRYLTTAPMYKNIIYDKYRKLYYRIAQHSTDYVNEDGMTVKKITDKPWSIILLDRNFEFIREINMDPRKYIARFYVIKDGLMVKLRQQHDPAMPVSWEFEIFNFESGNEE